MSANEVHYEPIIDTWEISNFADGSHTREKNIYHPENSSVIFCVTLHLNGYPNFRSAWTWTTIELGFSASDQSYDEAQIRMSILGSGKTLVYGTK